MINPYIALLISATLCTLVAVIMVGASRIIGPHNPTKTKLEIFEAGNPPVGSLRGMRFPVKFYLVAILFIIFDIEVVFMYPWAVIFRDLGWAGLAEMSAFVGILGVGLAYVWRVGALAWD
ncbi:MAG: NADH-quinone oxidoreductase subunit A [Deltaproteobacteria bacterium]